MKLFMYIITHEINPDKFFLSCELCKCPVTASRSGPHGSVHMRLLLRAAKIILEESALSA